MGQASDQDDEGLTDRDKAVQQISQMWYNNLLSSEGDIEAHEMIGLLGDIGEICEANGIDDPEERKDVALDGFEVAFEMMKENTMEKLEHNLESHFKMFGL